MKYGIQQKEVAKRSEDTLEIKADGEVAAKGEHGCAEPLWVESKETAEKIAAKHPGFCVIEIIGAVKAVTLNTEIH